jgi:ABC-type multidrug transport system fused ATPase/permease subunit
MNSVERVLYTTNQTPSEGPAVVDEILPTAFVPGITNNSNAEVPKSQGELVASGWPWRGGIVMQSAVMKYRDDFEAVLKGVNLKIAPGESIGIVGRTGSGKSSLLRALLRLTELNEGQVRG